MSGYQTNQGKNTKTMATQFVPGKNPFYTDLPTRVNTLCTVLDRNSSKLYHTCNTGVRNEINRFIEDWRANYDVIQRRWYDVTALPKTDPPSATWTGVTTGNIAQNKPTDIVSVKKPVGSPAMELPGGMPKIEEIIKTMNKLSSEMEEKDRQLAKMSSDMEQKDRKLSEMEKRAKATEGFKDIPKIEEMIKTMENLKSEMQEKDMKLAEMEKTNKMLTEGLSKEMNKKMSMDESNVESISTTNRPLKLAEDYSNFCSKEWMGAKEALDQKNQAISEQKKCEFLNMILWLAYGEMEETLKRQKESLLVVLNNPFETTGKGRERPRRHGEDVQLSGDLDLAMTNYLKTQNISLDFNKAVEAIMYKMENDSYLRPIASQLRGGKRLISYCSKACHLSWLMVIQRPPMTFEMASAVGQPYDPQETELAFQSAPPSRSGSRCLYYVHPALYHGDRRSKGKILVKGTVFFGKA